MTLGPTLLHTTFYQYEVLAQSVACESDSNPNTDKSIRIRFCPRLIMYIFNVLTSALIVTESQVSCISQVFYKYLSLHEIFSELPVSKIDLFTAVGKKPIAIKKISLQLCNGDTQLTLNFLVVPNWSNQIISDNDFLLRNSVQIDYKQHSIRSKHY